MNYTKIVSLTGMALMLGAFNTGCKGKAGPAGAPGEPANLATYDVSYISCVNGSQNSVLTLQVDASHASTLGAGNIALCADSTCSSSTRFTCGNLTNTTTIPTGTSQLLCQTTLSNSACTAVSTPGSYFFGAIFFFDSSTDLSYGINFLHTN